MRRKPLEANGRGRLLFEVWGPFLPSHADGHRLVEADSKAGVRRNMDFIAAGEKECVAKHRAAADRKHSSQRCRAGQLRPREGERPEANEAAGELLPG